MLSEKLSAIASFFATYTDGGVHLQESTVKAIYAELIDAKQTAACMEQGVVPLDNHREDPVPVMIVHCDNSRQSFSPTMGKALQDLAEKLTGKKDIPVYNHRPSPFATQSRGAMERRHRDARCLYEDRQWGGDDPNEAA